MEYLLGQRIIDTIGTLTATVISALCFVILLTALTKAARTTKGLQAPYDVSEEKGEIIRDRPTESASANSAPTA